MSHKNEIHYLIRPISSDPLGVHYVYILHNQYPRLPLNMLLEEALTSRSHNNSAPSPPDVAVALLSFLCNDLPAGGLEVQQRFARIFPLVMEWCFGNLRPDPSSGVTGFSESDEHSAYTRQQRYCHDANGCLALVFNPVEMGNDPIFQLLRAPRFLTLHGRNISSKKLNESVSNDRSDTATLLDVITITSKSDFPCFGYPFNALEQRLIDYWSQQLEAGTGFDSGFDQTYTHTRQNNVNTERLLKLLPDQVELRSYFVQNKITLKQRRGGGMTYPVQCFGGAYCRSPISPQGTNFSRACAFLFPSDGAKTLKVRLTSLAYYFFVFLRFPLLQQQSGVPCSTSDYGATLYSKLFSSYLCHYLPTVYDVANGTALHSDSELFLRLIIEFWLDHNSICATDEAVARYIAVFRKTPTLRDALELSKEACNNFRPLPAKVEIGILSMTKHLVSSVLLRMLVHHVSGLIQKRKMSNWDGTTYAEGENLEVPWCLPPAMTVIQAMMLNYIRIGLACGNCHEDSSFHRALEVWLLWLEPWNFVVEKRIYSVINNDGIRLLSRKWWIQAVQILTSTACSSNSSEHHSRYVQPDPTSRSMFLPQWEAYIAANLHFYTVPLAIFLRRAQEFDFSLEDEFSSSVALVQRVLRCYPEPIVKILTRVSSLKADTMTRGIVSWHERILGPYNPVDDWNLSSCQDDAINLVEYIFRQYRERIGRMTVFDRLKARVSRFSWIQMLSEEGDLQSILSQLKSIVGLPQEYKVSLDTTPQQFHGSLFSFLRKESIVRPYDRTGPERAPNGLLTDLGRQQIATGIRKCSPFDVRYIGDPMLAPYRSHEVPALVDLAIALSVYMNNKLGFVAKSDVVEEELKFEDMLSKNIREMEQYNNTGFRLNFRFLADYHNIVMLSCGIWILSKLW